MKTGKLGDLKIVRYGHPALREQASPVGRVTREVKALAARMIELMIEARGLGLAANQVGVPRRLAVVVIEDTPTVFIDPELEKAEGSEKAEEGCLSLPRLYGEVVRPRKVKVTARNLAGKRFTLEGEGLLARALCHELDHLEGRLFVDQVDESTLHWLLRTSDGEEPVVQPTALEDALKVFLLAREGEKHR